MNERNKVKKLSPILNMDATSFISNLYLKEHKCPLEISNFIFEKTGVRITTRSIQRNIKN